jgi:hypothetical protein
VYPIGGDHGTPVGQPLNPPPEFRLAVHPNKETHMKRRLMVIIPAALALLAYGTAVAAAANGI